MSNPGILPDGRLDPAYLARLQANNAPDHRKDETIPRNIGFPRPNQPYPPQQQYPPAGYNPYAAQPPYPNQYPNANPAQQQPYPPPSQPQQPYPPAVHQPFRPSQQPYPPPSAQQPFPPQNGFDAARYPNNLSQSQMVSQFRPTGRKKALLVGINYRGTSAQLRGCVRDVTYVHHLLTSKFGFQQKDFVVLTDESTNISGVRKGHPTRRVIIDSLKWLVSDAQPGDSLWFSFSGHGSQVRDTSGDESDGYDETILPVDYKSAGHIIDDELYEIVRRIGPGARLTVLLDACHSGTGLDLPYQHDIFGTGTGQLSSGGKPPSLASGLFGVANALLNGNPGGALAAGLNATGYGRKKKKQLPGPDPSRGEVLLFSGCKDNQTSADTSKLAGGLTTGAMTYALIETLEHSTVGDWHNYSYRKLLQTMRQKLRAARMSQTPQFSTSHPFDLASPLLL